MQFPFRVLELATYLVRILSHYIVLGRHVPSQIL